QEEQWLPAAGPGQEDVGDRSAAAGWHLLRAAAACVARPLVARARRLPVRSGCQRRADAGGRHAHGRGLARRLEPVLATLEAPPLGEGLLRPLAARDVQA